MRSNESLSNASADIEVSTMRIVRINEFAESFLFRNSPLRSKTVAALDVGSKHVGLAYVNNLSTIQIVPFGDISR